MSGGRDRRDGRRALADTQDPHDLARFVAAQDPVWPAVAAELAAGAKRSHWMWFVFPQLAGLGRSPTARRYAIASRAEAAAYARHPILGPRLLEATRLATAAPGSAEDVFGPVDAMKLRSSLTLFAEAAPDPTPFRDGLRRFFDGAPDPRTLELLGA